MIGVEFQGPSIPLEIVSSPLPDPKLLFQPSPIFSIALASGSGPTCSALAAPWHFPKVCPPAIRATVSLSFIAIRPNVSLTSFPEATAFGTPFGPSGFT